MKTIEVRKLQRLQNAGVMICQEPGVHRGNILRGTRLEDPSHARTAHTRFSMVMRNAYVEHPHRQASSGEQRGDGITRVHNWAGKPWGCADSLTGRVMSPSSVPIEVAWEDNRPLTLSDKKFGLLQASAERK